MYSVVDVIETVSDIAVTDHGFFYARYNSIHPSTAELRSALSGFTKDTNKPSLLFGFGSVLALDIIANQAIAIDLNSNRIIKQWEKSEHKYRFTDVDLSGLGYLHSYQQGDSKARSMFIDIDNSEEHTLDCIINQSFEQGKYLFSCRHDPTVQYRFLERFDSNGELLWHFEPEGEFLNLSTNENERNSIHYLIGVSKDNLWLVERNGDIVCINVNTGELLDRIDRSRSDIPGQENWPAGNTEFCLLQSYRFNETKTKIIGVASYQYYEIDLSEKKPIRRGYNLNSEVEHKDIRFEVVANSVFTDGDKVIFCDHSNATIVILNTATRKIVEIIPFGKHLSHDRIWKFIYSNKKMYVHTRFVPDSTGSLIILEAL